MCIPEAIENARQNRIDNSEFLRGDAAEAAAALQKRGLSLDVTILDPPRKGCSPSLIETAVQMAPQRIVYVSCNPTLTCNLQRFAALGYYPQEVTPVDLFP